MITVISNKGYDLPEPYSIPKVVFAALSPLEQIAAKALEKCGKVRIVEEEDLEEDAVQKWNDILLIKMMPGQ